MTGVAAGAGCLVIVFNYTGDRLNFGRAVAQATQAGTQVARHGAEGNRYRYRVPGPDIVGCVSWG